jgi:EpsI family protein
MALATEHREPIVSAAEGHGHAWLAALPIALVAAALLFAYRGALAAMVSMWDNSPMYSYGFTVPLVSGYLLWSRRESWRTLTPRPSWAAGAAVLLGAMGMTVAARAGGIQIIEQLAFLVALTAAVLLLFGTAYVRVAWASLAYLLLMIPIWDGFTEPLHEPFQQRSAAIGVWLLHLIGVPAFREGTFITLPNMHIEVARVCSGVNYLVAVVALGLPLGYVFLRSNWRRALLLAMAVVVAALSNGLRVALICTLAYYDVGSPLHGPFHVLHGLFVAGVGYVVLFAGLRLLAPRDGLGHEPSSPGGQAPAASMSGMRTVSLVPAMVLGAVFMLMGSSAIARESTPVPANAALSAFPNSLGAWTADPPVARLAASTLLATKNAAAESFPGADVEIVRRFRRADGAVVDLYLGYFAAQHQRKEMVTYRSADLHRRATRLQVSGASSAAFDVNYAAADRSGVEQMFWYDVDARAETDRSVVQARTLWNAIWSARSNGTVVLLRTQTVPGGAGQTALRDLAAYVHGALAAR